MAGGTFLKHDKVRPGAYINIKSNKDISTANVVSGTMTFPLDLDFGPEGEVIELKKDSSLTKFGYALNHAKMVLLREAFKHAETVLVYRVGTGGKATVTESSLSVTALYGGSRGNDISIVSKANINVLDAFDVETFLDGTSVDVQTVKNIEELQPNPLVSFSGSGELTAFSVKLSGGTDTEAIADDYMSYFEAIQVYDFNTLALPVAEDTIKTAGASFIQRLRDDEGKKCQLVVAGFDADSEAVINVKNGVVLSDGTRISKEQATIWVAGATAAAGVATSLTYTAYDGAVDVTQRFLNSEVVSALKTGEFVFTEKRGEVVVEQDINSLHTFTSEKDNNFSKNRVLRVLDDIANNSKKTFEDFFIGKANNDLDGQELFKANRVAYFDSLQGAGAITNFSAEDIVVKPGEEKDTILLDVAVQPVDSMEKLYMTVQVQ